MKRHIPRKRFGQHFLTDLSIIDTIIDAVNPKSDDVIIEIGPGLGALTKPLLQCVSNMRVIEIDRDLIQYWQQRYPERVQVYAGDVLDFDYAVLPSGFRLVGNLPYNISTPILFGLYSALGRLHDAHFMLQKEVVDRLTAVPGNKTYGRLSVMMQYAFEMEWLFDVPPEAFDPPPKVTSAVMRLMPRTKRPEVSIERLTDVVRAAFSQRRKKLSNVLKPYLDRSDFEALNIDPENRAEALGVEDFVRIANWLDENKNIDLSIV